MTKKTKQPLKVVIDKKKAIERAKNDAAKLLLLGWYQDTSNTEKLIIRSATLEDYKNYIASLESHSNSIENTPIAQLIQTIAEMRSAYSIKNSTQTNTISEETLAEELPAFISNTRLMTTLLLKYKNDDKSLKLYSAHVDPVQRKRKENLEQYQEKPEYIVLTEIQKIHRLPAKKHTDARQQTKWLFEDERKIIADNLRTASPDSQSTASLVQETPLPAPSISESTDKTNKNQTTIPYNTQKTTKQHITFFRKLVRKHLNKDPEKKTTHARAPTFYVFNKHSQSTQKEIADQQVKEAKDRIKAEINAAIMTLDHNKLKEDIKDKVNTNKELTVALAAQKRAEIKYPKLKRTTNKYIEEHIKRQKELLSYEIQELCQSQLTVIQANIRRREDIKKTYKLPESGDITQAIKSNKEKTKEEIKELFIRRFETQILRTINEETLKRKLKNDDFGKSVLALVNQELDKISRAGKYPISRLKLLLEQKTPPLAIEEGFKSIASAARERLLNVDSPKINITQTDSQGKEEPIQNTETIIEKLIEQTIDRQLNSASINYYGQDCHSMVRESLKTEILGSIRSDRFINQIYTNELLEKHEQLIIEEYNQTPENTAEIDRLKKQIETTLDQTYETIKSSVLTLTKEVVDKIEDHIEEAQDEINMREEKRKQEAEKRLQLANKLQPPKM